MPACPNCGEPNPGGARFCLTCGSPLSAEGTGGRAHETRRRVTVLFADLVGSTTIGERLDPEALDTGMSQWTREVACGGNCRTCGRLQTPRDDLPRIS